MQAADLLRQYKTMPINHWMILFELMPNRNKKYNPFIYLLSDEEDMKVVNEYNASEPARVWTVASAPNGLLTVTEGKDSARVFPLRAFGYLITAQKAEKNIKYVVKKKFRNQKVALNYFNGEENDKKI